MSRAAGLAFATILACGSCTIVNRIDVCQRTAPVEHQANQTPNCAQSIGSSQSIVPIAGGGAIVVFTSVNAATSCSEDHVDVAIARIAEDGSPLQPCSSSADLVVSDGSAAIVDAPRIAAPVDAMHPGLAVFAARSSSGPAHVYGRFVSVGACAEGATFAVDVDANDHLASTPAVARVGEDLFVVAWMQLSLRGDASPRVMARVVQNVFGVPMFVPTDRDVSGLPVDVSHAGNSTLLPSAVALPNGRAGLFWYELGSGVTVEFAVVDDRLREIAPPRAVDNDPSPVTAQSTLPAIAAATDGEQIFAAWSLVARDGASDVRGRFFDLDGRALSSPSSPDGAPFRVPTSAAGSAGRPTIAPVEGGGFLAAWESTAAPGAADRDGAGIRAAAFDRDGTRRFANRACDATDFQLNTGTAGNQTSPSICLSTGGAILAVWTDDGPSLADVSGSHIQAVAFRSYDLFGVRR